MCYTMQHIHIVYQRRRSTQGPNIRGILQCSTSTLSINVCSSTLVPNVRGVLQHSTLAVPKERSSSRQAPNIRGVSQCSIFTLSIKDVVQHKRHIHEVFCNAAHPVAILRGGWVGHSLPDFFLAPRLAPPVFS